MIRFACPRCKSVLEAPDDRAGSKIACPKCSQRLLIPSQIVEDVKIAAPRSQADSQSNAALKANQWAMFVHFSLLAGYIIPLAGWVLPIILWQMKKKDVPEIDAHGKCVCNWLLTQVLHSIILTAVMIVLVIVSILPPIGCIVIVLYVLCIPLLAIMSVLGIVYPIIGGIKANDGKLWLYPGTIHFLK